MPREQPVTRARPPLLGWISIGIAVLVSVLVVTPIIGLNLVETANEPASGGINAVSGGVSAWVLYAVLAVIAAGLLSAILGLARGERNWWVHAAGLVLNLASPLAALGVVFVR